MDNLDTIDELNKLMDDGEEAKEEVAKENEETPLKIEDEVEEEPIELKEEVEEEKKEEENKEEDEIKDLINSSFNRKKFIAEFPEAFKKYPQLERALYGNQEYRKVFPTLGDAKEASERLERFDSIEKDLETGSSEILLKNLKEKDQKAFVNIVDQYLPNLQKVDPEAHFHVVSNVFRQATEHMANTARETKNEDLLTAARIFYQYMFGTEKFEGPKSFGKQEDTEKIKLEEERKQFQNEQLSTYKNGIQTTLDGQIRATLEKVIDPKGAMTPYIKKQAVKDAQDMLAKAMKSDAEFNKILDKMYEKSAKNRFDQSSTTAIRDSLKSKAETLLPTIVRRVRTEALQGLGNGRKEKTAQRQDPLPAGRQANSQFKSNISKPSEIPKGMSTLDFLNRD